MLKNIVSINVIMYVFLNQKVSLIGFLVVLKLSDFSVQSNTTTTTSSGGVVNFLTHSEASEEKTGDNVEEIRQASSSPRKTPIRIPKNAEGTIFTPVGRRSVRIARQAKDD